MSNETNTLTHKPAPWEVRTFPIIERFRSSEFIPEEKRRFNESHVLDRYSYYRAIDCVNACADIENPTELIEQATQCVTVATQIMEENAAIKAMLKQICSAFGDLSNRPTFKSLNDAERRSIKLAREYLVKSEVESSTAN